MKTKHAPAKPSRLPRNEPVGVKPITFAGLAAVIDDARRAALSADTGPAEPKTYDELLTRLRAHRGKLPPLYEANFVAPFIATIEQLGAEKYRRLLASDPRRESSAGLLFDLAQAILQPGDGYARQSTRAYQELVSDLYDGFLSAEDRRGVKPPDLGVIPPLVKWGNPASGPYTWPVDAGKSFGVKAAVVNLPPANATRGLVAWSALGHETAGHDVLHADAGLQSELADAVRQRLASLGHHLADYWADRIDETASDVLGILNLGPAAGIGLIAYFRGLNGAWNNSPTLRNAGPDGDGHPADIVRGYLAAEVVALLAFSGRHEWSAALAAETDRDLRRIVLGRDEIAPALARQSARLVAEVLVQYKAKALESHALGEIQTWRDADELKANAVRSALRSGEPLPAVVGGDRIYAAHLVAGAVVEAVSTKSVVPALQGRLISLLDTLHDQNPAWGPLYVEHPGDMVRDLLYVRPESPRKSIGASGGARLSTLLR